MNSFGPHLLSTLQVHVTEDTCVEAAQFHTRVTAHLSEGWRFGGWVLCCRGRIYTVTALFWRGSVGGLTMLTDEFKTVHQTWQDLL